MKLTASLINKTGPSSTSDTTKLSSSGHTSRDSFKNLSKSDRSYGRDDILSHSLALTGHIFGLYAIELWRYDEGDGKLVNVSLGQDEEAGSGGHSLYIKRVTQEADESNGYSMQDAGCT